MLVLAAICAVAHTPHFAGGKHCGRRAERSHLLPRSKGHIRYKAGNFIHVAILEPQRLGASAVGVLGSVSQNFSCRLGAPASSDHASNRTAGSLVYEPFGESDLRVVVVVATGHQSDSDQTCTLVVSADAPYVVAVGTQEEFWLAYFVGLSWYVMRVSAWVGNYAYGYALIATLAVAGLACRATRGRQAAAVAIALFAALEQACTVGRDRVGHVVCGMATAARGSHGGCRSVPVQPHRCRRALRSSPDSHALLRGTRLCGCGRVVQQGQRVEKRFTGSADHGRDRQCWRPSRRRADDVPRGADRDALYSSELELREQARDRVRATSAIAQYSPEQENRTCGGSLPNVAVAGKGNIIATFPSTMATVAVATS